MPEQEAEKTPYNPFDLTKVWPHADYPLIEVGVLELNRNPENYFAEVEQAAFSPANVVPGISHRPDKMLQVRIFSYADAHRYRLGVNYESLPVNRPQLPGAHLPPRRPDALRRQLAAARSTTSPTASAGRWRIRSFREPPLQITGDADRYDHRAGNDDYTQAGNLFRLHATEPQRQRLMDTIAGRDDAACPRRSSCARSAISPRPTRPTAPASPPASASPQPPADADRRDAGNGIAPKGGARH